MKSASRVDMHFVLVLGLLGLNTSVALAWDDVRVSKPDRVSVLDLSGRILDWNANELVLERITPAGTSRIPAAEVADIRYEALPDHQQAEIELVLGNFQKAMSLFALAEANDPRAWVQRELIARQLLLATSQRNWEQAGTLYKRLLNAHEHPRHRDAIPVLWVWDQRPDEELFRVGRVLLNEPDPELKLIGCSLLIVPDRVPSKAIDDQLRVIGRAAQPEIRILSRAMSARGRLSAEELSVSEVESWERFLNDLSAEWQHGPRLVLSQGYLKVDQPSKALEHASWVVANTQAKTLHNAWGHQLVEQALGQLQQ